MLVRGHYLLSDRNSHIYKHFQGSESCKTVCSGSGFSTLDSALTAFQLKIKEALHIEWELPAPKKKQLKHVNLTLLLYFFILVIITTFFLFFIEVSYISLYLFSII